MYSKTRNTLTALIVASLFLTAGWTFGRPVEASVAPQNVASVQVSIAGSGAQISLGPAVLHARHANRMSLAMPFYSFSLAMSQRRAD
ncbi:MAG TPA: hypothetical protein VK753_04705 [Xanthomonadaceae bacterium]|jgi:hypothetical protein|nr:hypothetical protein [Xanthomonadaceae bacterium]